MSKQEEPITEPHVEAFLLQLLTEDAPSDWGEMECNIRTFEEAGLLTKDRGLVLKFYRDGSEFQLTIQQVK